jgi:hypothetical protein
MTIASEKSVTRFPLLRPEDFLALKEIGRTCGGFSGKMRFP